MAKTRTCELTDEEMALIEGLRQGRLVLNKERWLKVSREENELITLIRAGKFGLITVKFIEGKPKISKVNLEFVHGRFGERQTALDLLAELEQHRI